MKRNKKLAVLFFLAIICTSAFAQNEVFVPGAGGETVFSFHANTYDPDIRQIPSAITSLRQRNTIEFIRLLAEYINEKSGGDFDRVKKAHDWVALNIRYDTQSYFSGRYSSQAFDDVIRRGSAVCAGYSDVFKHICDALEIECITVTGYARGASSSLFRFVDVTNSNHAWNIVTINGKKYLVDTTWDSGYLSGRNFQARYQTNYLFTDPAVFIYEHFPGSSDNQLLEQPLSAEEFDNLPFLESKFFIAFETWPQMARITEISAGEELQFEFSLKSGYELAYHWYRQSGAEISRTFPPRRDSYRINIPKLNPGRYFLRLYVKGPGDRRYWSCAEYGFVIN